jgi:dipeptidyl aminopeptidase/acylaminoacyl peptidase
MPDLDQYLRDELRRTIAPVDVNDVSSKIDVRRSRRVRLRKMQAVGLTVIVLAGTVGGVAMLSRAFRESGPSVGAAPDVRNGVIVYSEVRNAGQHLWVVNPDGSGARLLTIDEGVSDSDPSISPDGRTVAFVRTGANGSSICTIGIDGDGLEEFSPGDVFAFAPSWSPDGTQIAFAGADGGIYVGDMDRSEPQLIVDRSVVATHLSWSPDGTRIAFAAAPAAATGPRSNYDLWITDVTDVSRSTQINITRTSDSSELSPSWSPDGSQILFSSDAVPGSSLFTMSPDPEASPVALTDGTTFDQNPAWSPDGSFIVFDRTSPDGPDVFTARPDGSELSSVAHNAMDPAWQPIPSDPTPSPATPSPSTGGQVDIGLGFPVCHVETLQADFDGNGAPDTAWTAAKASDEPCSAVGGGFTVVAIDVTGDGVADGAAGPLEHCILCHPFDAVDMDGDGIDELVVVTQAGSVSQYALFSIRPDRAADGQAIVQIDVAAPGHPAAGFAPGEPFLFWAGGDEGYASYVRCRAHDPTDLLIQQTSEPVDGSSSDVRTIFTTQLRLENSSMTVFGSGEDTQPVSVPFNGASRGPACGVDFYP